MVIWGLGRVIISLFSLLWQRWVFGAAAWVWESDSSRPPESGGRPVSEPVEGRRIPGLKCRACLAPIDTGLPVLGLRAIRARR